MPPTPIPQAGPSAGTDPSILSPARSDEVTMTSSPGALRYINFPPASDTSTRCGRQASVGDSVGRGDDVSEGAQRNLRQAKDDCGEDGTVVSPVTERLIASNRFDAIQPSPLAIRAPEGIAIPSPTTPVGGGNHTPIPPFLGTSFMVKQRPGGRRRSDQSAPVPNAGQPWQFAAASAAATGCTSMTSLAVGLCLPAPYGLVVALCVVGLGGCLSYALVYAMAERIGPFGSRPPGETQSASPRSNASPAGHVEPAGLHISARNLDPGGSPHSSVLESPACAYDPHTLMFVTTRDVAVQCVALRAPGVGMEVLVNLAATVAAILGDNVFIITADTVLTFYEGPHRVETSMYKMLEVQTTVKLHFRTSAGAGHAPGRASSSSVPSQPPPDVALSFGVCAEGDVLSGKIGNAGAYLSAAITTSMELAALCPSFDVPVLLAAKHPPVFVHQALAATQVDLLSFNRAPPTPVYTIQRADAGGDAGGYAKEQHEELNVLHVQCLHALNEKASDTCMEGWASIREGKLVAGKSALAAIKLREPWVQAMQRRVARLIAGSLAPSTAYTVAPQWTTGVEQCEPHDGWHDVASEEDDDLRTAALENDEEREYRMLYLALYLPERKFVVKLKEILVSFTDAVAKNDGVVDQLSSDMLIARWRVEYSPLYGTLERTTLSRVVSAVRLISTTLPQPFHIGIAVGDMCTLRLKNQRETVVSEAKNHAVALAMLAYNYGMNVVAEADVLDTSHRQADRMASLPNNKSFDSVDMARPESRVLATPQEFDSQPRDSVPERRLTNPLISPPEWYLSNPAGSDRGTPLGPALPLPAHPPSDTESVDNSTGEGVGALFRGAARTMSAVSRFVSMGDISISSMPSASSLMGGHALVCRKLTTSAYYNFVETQPVPRGRKRMSGFCAALRMPKRDVTLFEIISDTGKAQLHQEHAVLYNKVLRRISARSWEKALQMLNRYNSVAEGDHWTEFLLEQVQQAISDEGTGKRNSDDDLDLHINLVGEVAVGRGSDGSSSEGSSLFSPQMASGMHDPELSFGNAADSSRPSVASTRAMSDTSPCLVPTLSPRRKKQSLIFPNTLDNHNIPSRVYHSPPPALHAESIRSQMTVESVRSSRTARTAVTLPDKESSPAALPAVASPRTINFRDRGRVRQYLGMSSCTYSASDGTTSLQLAVYNAFNLIRLALMILDCIVTPARAALPGRLKGVYDTQSTVFIALGYITDMVYFVDILQNFHEPVTNDLGVLITNPREIRSIYLRGWFSFDLVGMLPWELVMMLATGRFGLLVNHPEVRLNRLVNMLRMPNLTYVVANAYFPEVHPVLTKAFVHVSFLLVLLFWIGCLWNYMLFDYWPTTPMASSRASDGIFRHSLRGFHWSFRGFAGYGQPWPVPDEEYLPALVNVIFGIGAFATVIAYCHSTLGMTHDAVFQERLDDVVQSAEELKVSKATTKQMLKYHRILWEKTGQVYRGQFDDLMNELPRELSMELTYFANIRALRQIPSLMAVADDRYVVHLACRMVHRFGVPQEVLIEQGEPFQDNSNSGVFFLTKGTLTAEANNTVIETVKPGSYWGELSCLNSSPQPASLVVSDYSEIYFLPYSTFRDLFEQYPAAAEVFVETSNRRRMLIKNSAHPEEDDLTDVGSEASMTQSPIIGSPGSCVSMFHLPSPRAGAEPIGAFSV